MANFACNFIQPDSANEDEFEGVEAKDASSAGAIFVRRYMDDLLLDDEDECVVRVIHPDTKKAQDITYSISVVKRINYEKSVPVQLADEEGD